MDPLSITASIVTFIDIAKRIKASVDKISQNRKTLQILTANVVSELATLQDLCRGDELGQTRPDVELAMSLQDLRSELLAVSGRCEMILQPGRRSRLSSIKTGFIAWMKSGEIEADIARLKLHISSFHRRFVYMTSLRMQNSMLIVNSEHRARMNRMEGLVSRLLIDSHMNGVTQPIVGLRHPSTADIVDPGYKFVDAPCSGGSEYQFLQWQVQKLLDSLTRISSSRAFSREEPNDAHSKYPTLCINFPKKESLTCMFWASVARVAQLLLELESTPSHDISLQTGAYDLLILGGPLRKLGLGKEAFAVRTWALDVYRTLTTYHPEAFMPYVAWTLDCLGYCLPGMPQSLEASKLAVETWRALYESEPSHRLSYLSSLYGYCTQLRYLSQDELSIALAMEALTVFRSTKVYVDAVVLWEAPGSDVALFSSERTFRRDIPSAYLECLCLRSLALSLAALGRYSEAIVAVHEALICYQALLGYCPGLQEDVEWAESSRSSWALCVP